MTVEVKDYIATKYYSTKQYNKYQQYSIVYYRVRVVSSNSVDVYRSQMYVILSTTNSY